MKANEIILKSLEENAGYIADAVKDLTPEELAWNPRPHSNSIIFLIWHLARVEDLWINQVLKGGQQLYEADGWYRKFGTEPQDNGFGYTVEKLAVWKAPSLELLGEYAAAVRKTAVAYIKGVTENELDEEKDFGWSKGTVGSALSHLISEVGEHSGQIGYIKGIMKGIAPVPPPPPKK